MNPRSRTKMREEKNDRCALHLKDALHIGSSKMHTLFEDPNCNALSASLQVQCSSDGEQR